MERLNPGQWLDDSLIDLHIRAVHLSLPDHRRASVHIFSSLLFPKLHDEANPKVAVYNAAVQRWTMHDTLFEKEMLVIPIHIGCHFSLCCVLRLRALAAAMRMRIEYNTVLDGNEHSSCIVLLDSIPNCHDMAFVGGIVQR